MLPTSDPDEPADSNDAFRPSSPWWGAMLCPVAAVVGAIQIQQVTATVTRKPESETDNA